MPLTDRLRRTAILIWASVGALVLLGVTLWAAAQVRIIWLPLIFAGGLVVILDPLVRSLQRIGIHRVVGTLFAYVAAGAAVTAVGFLVVPLVREQFQSFLDQLPGLYDEAVAWMMSQGERFGVDLGPVWTSETIRAWIQDPANQQAIQDLIGGFGTGAGRLIAGVAETVVVVVLAPVLAFYMLVDLPRTRRMARQLTPPRLRDEAVHVAGNIGTALGGFVRGQFLVALMVGILSSLALWLLDLPFWLIIGMTSGLLNLVPFIGPVFGGGVALLTALLVGEPAKGLIAVAAFTAIQQLDNHVITPLIQRARVKLSPLTIVLALLIGGSVAGLLGVLIAVPGAAVVRIVAGHMWRTRVLGESWAEASEAMIEETQPPERLARRLRTGTGQPKLFDTAEIAVTTADEDAFAGDAEEPVPPR